MRRATRRLPCAERENGCREQAFYEFDSQRDAREFDQRRRGPWRCTRHSTPTEVVSVESPAKSVTMVVSRPDFATDRLFWAPEGGRAGSGVLFGPGFRAFADDFPVGTRLTVTATLAAAQPTTTEAS